MGKKVSGTTSVGIGATVDNVLSGKLFEISPDNAIVSFAALAASGDIRATIYVGSDIVADDAQLQIGTAIKWPDDVIAQHGAFKNERITLKLRQVGGAGAVNVVWAADFEAVE